MKRFMTALMALFILAGSLGSFPFFGVQEAAAAEPKLVAFTFDDGPSPQTERLLDGLKEQGVPATFFMNGTNGYAGIVNWRHLLKRMMDEGHQLANHTNSHKVPFNTLSSASMKAEVSKVQEYLYEAMGGTYRDCVRIPGGARSDRISSSVEAPMIWWSVDTRDWESRNASRVYNMIMSYVHDGAVVLMHDLYGTTVDAALRAIPELKRQGYEFVTVAELFRRRGVSLTDGATYYSAPPSGGTLPAYLAPTVSIETNAALEIQVHASSSVTGLTYYFTEDGSLPNLSSKRCGVDEAQIGARICVAGIDEFGTRTPVTEITVENPYWPVFDAVYYADTNSDLKRAYGYDEIQLFRHFRNYGVSEGRVASPIFSVQEYMNRYSDVREVYQGSRFAAVNHFVVHGMKEQRVGIRSFEVFTYREMYPDLQRAFGGDIVRYYRHFVQYGYREGRRGVPAPDLSNPAVRYGGEDYSAVYNFKEYVAAYADIREYYSNDDQAALRHFVIHGMNEGRMGRRDFNVYAYKSRYADLREAYGENLKSYYLHYCWFGQREKRKAK